MFLYPTQFPLDAISKARQIIQAGEWAEQKARLAKCEAEIQCYAFLLFFGDPDVVGTQSAEAVERLLPNNDQLAALEQLVAHCDNCQAIGPEQPEAAGADVGLDPVTLATLIATLLPMAKQLLEWIRNRRNPQPPPAPTSAT